MVRERGKHHSIFDDAPVKGLWLLAAMLWAVFFVGELILQLVTRYSG